MVEGRGCLEEWHFQGSCLRRERQDSDPSCLWRPFSGSCFSFPSKNLLFYLRYVRCRSCRCPPGGRGTAGRQPGRGCGSRPRSSSQGGSRISSRKAEWKTVGQLETCLSINLGGECKKICVWYRQSSTNTRKVRSQTDLILKK